MPGHFRPASGGRPAQERRAGEQRLLAGFAVLVFGFGNSAFVVMCLHVVAIIMPFPTGLQMSAHFVKAGHKYDTAFILCPHCLPV